MELTTFFLLASLFAPALYVIIKLVVQRIKLVKAMSKIPGPRGYPIIGNAHQLLVPRNKLQKTFENITKQWKPLFVAWAGPIPVVHITRPEHAEIIMSSTINSHKSVLYEFVEPWLGTGLLTASGPKWQSHRKMITPTFHFEILDIFQDVFHEKCQILVEKLKDKANKEPFDISPYITRCTLDIICETAMGTQINAQEQTDSDYIRAVYEVSELITQRFLQPWVHPTVIYNLTRNGKRFKECLGVLHGFTTKVIKERQILKGTFSRNKTKASEADEDEKSLGKKKRLAFLDLLLEASQDSSGRTALTDVEIREEVDTFMFEGHDTTSAAINWTLFLLGYHPEYQEKVMEELSSIFQGSDRQATTRDLNEMKYLEMCIKEALRLFPSVPFISRTLGEDTKFDSYFVPKGTNVFLQIYEIHRCQDQFPNPSTFDPDNFLPERVSKRHPFSYIPFSAGPRNCVGQKFAMMEEKTILSSILRHYRVESVDKFEDLILMVDLVLRPESGIALKLIPRTL